MRKLEFVANAQMLTKKPGCDFSKIVAGSVGYLKAVFNFSEEWNECRKVATFYSVDHPSDEYAVLLDEHDSCDIPAQVLKGKSFMVYVTGARNTDYILNTTTFRVRQEVC